MGNWTLCKKIFQETHDPFKNSQIVLFVYITQGAAHLLPMVVLGHISLFDFRYL